MTTQPQKLDPTKGLYWRDYRDYRNALLRLQGIVGTKSFLWFEVVPTFVRFTDEHDLVRWEREIPFNEIPAFLHKDGRWESLFTKSPSFDWGKLLVSPTEEEATNNGDITCLVRFPEVGAKAFEMKPKYGRSLGSGP